MGILEDLLRRFTIRLRMIGAILMVLALLAAVGGAGLLGMFNIQAKSEAFFEHSVSEAGDLRTLTQSMGDIRRFEKDMILSYEQTATLEQYKVRWEKSLADARKAVDEMQKGEADADNAVAAALGAHLKAYQDKFQNIARQLAAGAYDNATVANKLAAPAK